MPAVEEVSIESALIRMMLYAPPGWRKTSLIATAAAAGQKVLLIRSPLDLVPKRIIGSGVQQMVVKTWEDMMGEGGALEYLQYKGREWDWVWLDCLSIMQDVLLDDIWEATRLDKPARDNLTPTGGKDRGEYGRNMERIGEWIRHVIGCNTFNFGVTCHPWEGPHPVDDEATSLLLQPWIQGKNMIPKICGYMNVVAFLELKETDAATWSRLHVKESPRFYAKDLFDAYPKGYADNPTLPQIQEALRGLTPRTTGAPAGMPPAAPRGRGRLSVVPPTPTPARGKRGRGRREQ